MLTPEIFTGLFVLTVPVLFLIALGWFALGRLNRRDQPRRRDDDTGKSSHPRPPSPPASERLVPRYGAKVAPSSTRHPAAPGHSRSRQPQDTDALYDDGITIPAVNNPAVYVSDSSPRASESSIRGSCAGGGFVQDNSPTTSTYSSSDSSSSSNTSSSSSCE